MMSRTLLLLVYAASLAAAATAASPPCHAPWGNEQALESPCFATVFQQGDVSVRRYAPRGANYAQAFVQASFPGGGNPTEYLTRLDEAVIAQLQYFDGHNSKGATIVRTSPILGRPNSTGLLLFDWMLPTTAFPAPAKAPVPSAPLHLQLVPSTLGANKNLVAALHFTLSGGGVPGPGDFDEACDTLRPLLPSMGYVPVENGLWSPTYAYYTSRDFDGQHDGECLIEVLKA
jgi:hypothetical protein